MFSYPQYTLLLRKNQSRFPFEKRLSETDNELAVVPIISVWRITVSMTIGIHHHGWWRHIRRRKIVGVNMRHLHIDRHADRQRLGMIRIRCAGRTTPVFDIFPVMRNASGSKGRDQDHGQN